MKTFSTGMALRFLRQTFFIGLSLSIVVYTWVRLLFFEADMQFSEEAINLFKVIMTGWIMMIFLKGLFHTMLILGEYLPRMMARNKLVAPALLFLGTGGILLLFMW